MTAGMGQDTVRTEQWFVTNRVLTPKEQQAHWKAKTKEN